MGERRKKLLSKYHKTKYTIAFNLQIYILISITRLERQSLLKLVYL